MIYFIYRYQNIRSSICFLKIYICSSYLNSIVYNIPIHATTSPKDQTLKTKQAKRSPVFSGRHNPLTPPQTHTPHKIPSPALPGGAHCPPAMNLSALRAGSLP